MTENDLYENFDYIGQVANKIAEIINNDDSCAEWIGTILDKQNESGEFPKETFDLIGKILQKHDKKLFNDFRLIYSNEDFTETLLSLIFYPNNNEEQWNKGEGEEEQEAEDNSFDISDYDQVTNPNSLTPEALEEKQANLIKKISDTLYISNDLAYLLLRHFDWNSENLIETWTENEDNVELLLEKLKVPKEMQRENLRLKYVGKGECDVCFNDDCELFQLYCGHILCENCWREEIKTQLDQGNSSVLCRIDQCNSEIMLEDVAKLCGKEKADSFKRFILEDQIMRDNKLVHCPGLNCDQILTLDSVGYCNIATCSSCGYRMCWKCHGEAHAPLKCEKKDDWDKERDEMIKLSKAQSQWEAREISLADYRSQHIDEIKTKNRITNQQLELEDEKKSKAEIEEINNLQNEIKKIADEGVKQAKTKILKLKENEHKINDQERQKLRNAIKDEQMYYIQAIHDPLHFAFFFRQLKESQEMRTLSKLSLTDSEYIERMTKKCPNCKSPILKTGGCNYMRCTKCNYEFCWVCSSDWKTHGDHFVCNKFDKTSIEDGDFDDDDSNSLQIDPNDKDYYEPPMTIEKREKFSRWSHYFKRYQIHRDTQKIEKQIRDKCREVLVHSWNLMSKNSANLLVDRVYRSIDIARSVLMYSYPTAYFMNPSSKALHIFEIYQSNLELSNEKLAGMVERFDGENNNEFEKFTEMNEKYAEILLRHTDASLI